MLAPHLPPLPSRFKSLPLDPRGYPVPKFVAQIDGRWDFRCIRPGWLGECYQKRRCWLCGEQLGRSVAFVIGPMCAINRVTSEPPSHYECAEYATRSCPFMMFPNRKRDAVNLPPDGSIAGMHIDRNPGVTCIWITRHGYRPFQAGDGYLFKIGDAERCEWRREGRAATRDEVLASIESGLPFLLKIAEQEGPRAVEALMRQRGEALGNYIPGERLAA